MKRLKVTTESGKFTGTYLNLEDFMKEYDLEKIGEPVTMETIEVTDFNDKELMIIGMIYALKAYYYEQPLNGVGGSLHILLDDGNYDQVKFCQEVATRRGDIVGIALCDLLGAFTPDQIEEILEHEWRYIDAIRDAHLRVGQKDV